jgi:hypothetical protein
MYIDGIFTISAILIFLTSHVQSTELVSSTKNAKKNIIEVMMAEIQSVCRCRPEFIH